MNHIDPNVDCILYYYSILFSSEISSSRYKEAGAQCTAEAILKLHSQHQKQSHEVYVYKIGEESLNKRMYDKVGREV